MTCVEESSLERLLSASDVAGFVRYEIDSRTIGCKNTLLAAALTKGFELEVEGELDSWDAAADLIWQKDCMEQNGNKAALIRRTAQSCHLPIIYSLFSMQLNSWLEWLKPLRSILRTTVAKRLFSEFFLWERVRFSIISLRLGSGLWVEKIRGLTPPARLNQEDGTFGDGFALNLAPAWFACEKLKADKNLY
ncbi:MAG: hypothetical protein QM813_27460 [Verrucomicrobiota bacterium]